MPVGRDSVEPIISGMGLLMPTTEIWRPERVFAFARAQRRAGCSWRLLASPARCRSHTKSGMKRPQLITAVFVALTFHFALLYAAGENFAGEYADKKFMNGQAILQLSLEQSGNQVTIFFSGVRNDGQGAAPEINTTGTVTGGKVQFKFTDDLRNSGTGTITKAGEDAIVSIKPTKVVDSRCMQFYGQDMRLKRLRK